MDFIAAASEMREKAWAEVTASSAFRAFRAADNMVVELGGASAMPKLSNDQEVRRVFSPLVTVAPAAYYSGPAKPTRKRRSSDKPTQSDAAMTVLRELGPMGIKDILDLAVAQGATAGGSNPLVNFRSALSKDERLYSFRHNGEYLWWITGVDLPEGWDEAASDLLANAASSDSSQEGGDGHAANNTVLTQ